MGFQKVRFPAGFSAWGIYSGIKGSRELDLGILVSNVPARVFGSFTKNQFPAAPVDFCKKALLTRKPVTHILVNSGNANAATGSQGLKDAESSAQTVKKYFPAAEGVLVCSTGLIGQCLPMEKIKAGIQNLADFKPPRVNDSFARAIMTTDTVPKVSQSALKLGTKKIRICGFAKGSGMINPNMATMLAYVTTDITLPQNYQKTFQEIVEKSFNSITIDGDMSTNDTVLLMSNGAGGVKYTQLSQAEKKRFTSELTECFTSLAKQIVRDGEGATKFIDIEIRGAATRDAARKYFKAVANSPLVKTAFFGCDPNWGRVIAVLGSLEIPLDPEKVDLSFCGIKVFKMGRPVTKPAASLQSRMKQKNVSLNVDLRRGKHNWTGWTCDLSYRYVEINAEYHT